MTKYDYPFNGAYNVTEATLSDGKQIMVDVQHSHVWAICGSSLDGVDADALVRDARINGKFGRPEKVVAEYVHVDEAPKTGNNQPCPKCGSWCEGDCQAN